MTKTQFLLSSLILLLTLMALTSCGKKKSNQPLALSECSKSYFDDGNLLIKDIDELKKLSKESTPFEISKLPSTLELIDKASAVTIKCKTFIEANPKYRGCKDSVSHQVIDQRTIEKKCHIIQKFLVSKTDKTEDQTKFFDRTKDKLAEMINKYSRLL